MLWAASCDTVMWYSISRSSGRPLAMLETFLLALTGGLGRAAVVGREEG